MNQHKIKSATWEDSSTPFHFGRNDMSGGGTIQPYRLYSKRGGRQIAAPTGIIPFNRTGCTQTLLGDESSPLHCVVPFNRTGCIRDVVGGFFTQRISKTGTSVPQIIVNCPLSIVNFPAVPLGFAGWDAFFPSFSKKTPVLLPCSIRKEAQ